MHILPPTFEFWCFPSCMPSLLLYVLDIIPCLIDYAQDNTEPIILLNITGYFFSNCLLFPHYSSVYLNLFSLGWPHTMFYLLTLFIKDSQDSKLDVYRSYMNCWPQICEDKLHYLEMTLNQSIIPCCCLDEVYVWPLVNGTHCYKLASSSLPRRDYRYIADKSSITQCLVCIWWCKTNRFLCHGDITASEWVTFSLLGGASPRLSLALGGCVFFILNYSETIPYIRKAIWSIWKMRITKNTAYNVGQRNQHGSRSVWR